WAGNAVLALGNELHVHGHSAEAGTAYALVVDWARALAPEKANTRRGRDLLLAALYRSNQLAVADSVTRAPPLGESASGTLVTFHGLTAARLGNVAEAERTSARLAALTTPYLWGRHTLGRAQIAAILGHKNEATRLARQAFGEGVEVPALHATPEFLAL